MDFISLLHSSASRPYSAKKATVLFFRIAGLFACFFFSFSEAKMIYLSFDGNGWIGFWVGFFNVLVVNAAFLAVFHASLCPSRKLRPFVLYVGTLLSCNSVYFATVRQSLFDRETVVLQPFLYLLPLVSTAIFLYHTQKSKIGSWKQLFADNLYLSIATIYVLMYLLFPLNRSFQIWNQLNIIILCLLAVFQMRRNTLFDERRIIMKKFICLMSIFIVCLCMPSVYAENSSDNLDLIKKIGQCERPLTDSEKGKIILKGDSISIFEGELQQVTERCKLTGKDNPEEHAKEYLLRREALYQKALAAEYSVTDDEVYANIEKQKKGCHEVDLNPEDVNAYFEGMGMTIDEYWDTQFDTLKKEMITGKYVSSQKAKFAKDNSITQWDYDIRKDFQVEISKIADTYIVSDHVKPN